MLLQFISIGKYLDREIQIAQSKTIDFSVEKVKLENSMIFILMHTVFSNPEKISNFIQYLISLEPVGIAFWGKNSETYWSLLVDLTSQIIPSKHTMTYYTDEENIEEGLETMFFSFLPSEDRWDNWAKYSVISIGEPEDKNIEAIIKNKFND